MCPALKHWKQLIDPELQSRVPLRAKTDSVTPQDGMPFSAKDEENLFRIAMVTEDSMRRRAVQKQFKDNSAGSIDTQDGNGRAPIQMTSDNTGELNFRGKESLIHFISTVVNWKRNSFEVNWKENSVKVNWRESDASNSAEAEEDTRTPGR